MISDTSFLSVMALLKSSGAAFHAHVVDCMISLGYVSCLAGPDLWMKAEINADGDKYYSYILCYVDNVLVVHHNTMKTLCIVTSIARQSHHLLDTLPSILEQTSSTHKPAMVYGVRSRALLSIFKKLLLTVKYSFWRHLIGSIRHQRPLQSHLWVDMNLRLTSQNHLTWPCIILSNLNWSIIVYGW